MLDCSVVSVRRVMSDYAGRGLLERRHRSGTRTPGTNQPRREAREEYGSDRAGSAAAIRNDMLTAIARGKYKQGTALPLNKQVSMQLHVSPATVTEAYRMLQREGYVTKVGKHYWVGGVYGSLHWSVRRECLVLSPDGFALASMFKSHPLKMNSAHLALSLRKMESRLSDQGWHLKYKRYSELESLTDLWKKRGRLPDGFLLFGHDGGLTTGKDFHYVHAVIARLTTRMGLPFPPMLAITKNFIDTRKNCRFYSTSHTLTILARTTARFALMHDPARFVIVLKEDYPPGNVFNFLRIYPEIRKVNKTMEISVMLLSDNPAGARSRVLTMLYSHYGFEHIEARLAVDGILVRKEFENMFRGVRSLADALAERRKRTMYVVRDDKQAADMLQWCSSKGIDVGESLLLLSYENNPDYFGHGITACVSDWETDGYLMAHALIGDIPIARTGRGFIRTRARILRRLTA